MLTFDFPKNKKKLKNKNCCSIGSWHLTGKYNCSWCQIPVTPTINERLATALGPLKFTNLSFWRPVWWTIEMSASVAVYRNIYTEDRFRQAYGTEEQRGRERLRHRLAQRCSCSQVDCAHLLKKRVPVCNWLPKYKLRKWILGDIVAGLTVGIVHIPQGKLLFHFWGCLKQSFIDLAFSTMQHCL